MHLGVGRAFGDLFADWNAGDGELRPAATVALDEDADGVAAEFFGQDAGGGAGAAFEAVADHAGASADVALGD